MTATQTSTKGPAANSRGATPVQRAQHILHEHTWVSPLVLLVLSIAVFTLLNPAFAQPRAISLLLQQTAVVAALAVGQTLIILTGGIDLSVGAAAILACMSSALLATNGVLPAPLAILAGVLIGAICGLVNGALVSRIKLPPFIVTLGTLSVFTAITLMLTGGSTIQGTAMPDWMTAAGTRVPFFGLDLNVGIIVVALIYVAVGYALGFTAWGRRVFAVGDAPEAARLAGISVSRVLLSVYLVAGLIYGIAAWVLIGRAGAASPNGVVDANLASITAVVIGGTSLFGGRGGVIGTVLGALIVQSFAIGLTLVGLDDEYRVLAVGILVIAAVAADQWIRKVRS
jgi:fructose transport system permease protein